MVHGFNDDKEKVEVIAGNVIRVRLEDSVPANESKHLTWQYNLTENGYSKVDLLSCYQHVKTDAEYHYVGGQFPSVDITYSSNPDEEFLVEVDIIVNNNSSNQKDIEGGFSLILLP